MSLNQQLELVEWIKWPIQLAIATAVLQLGVRLRLIILGLLAGTAAAWIAMIGLQEYIVIPLRNELLASDEAIPTWMLTPKVSAGAIMTEAKRPTLEAVPVERPDDIRDLIEMPDDIRALIDKADENSYQWGYDPGMVDNSLLMLFGWLPPLIWLLAVLLMRQLWQLNRRLSDANRPREAEC